MFHFVTRSRKERCSSKQDIAIDRAIKTSIRSQDSQLHQLSRTVLVVHNVIYEFYNNFTMIQGGRDTIFSMKAIYHNLCDVPAKRRLQQKQK